MALDGKILRRAMDRYEQQLRRREADTAMLRQLIYRKDPRIAELDSLLRSTVAEAAAIAVSGSSDPVKAVAAVQEKNLAYQEERHRRIRALGFSETCLDNIPFCPDCNDRGWVGTKPCHCLRRLYAEEQRKELSSLLDLQGERFEEFRLNYYEDRSDPLTGMSPRRNMEMVLTICRSYAENFTPGSGNLFLTGNPGLGKTFLSACIASAVAEKGFSVVYDTAGHITSRFDEARFNRHGEQEEAESDVRRCLRCDLLILDDLGTEPSTTFSVSAIYDLLNTRLRESRSMIISSNLSPDELDRCYNPQIASRLRGNFEVLRFYGQDIRRLKKLGRSFA